MSTEVHVPVPIDNLSPTVLSVPHDTYPVVEISILLPAYPNSAETFPLCPSSKLDVVVEPDPIDNPPPLPSMPAVKLATLVTGLASVIPVQFVDPIVSVPKAVFVSIVSVLTPPVRVDTPVTPSVVLAESAPVTVRPPAAIVERPAPVTVKVPVAEMAAAAKLVVVTAFSAVAPNETFRPDDEFNPTAPTEPLADKLTTLAVPAETVSEGVDILVAVNACKPVAPETVADPATTIPPTQFTLWPTRPKYNFAGARISPPMYKDVPVAGELIVGVVSVPITFV
jgi:hypothetical protein